MCHFLNVNIFYPTEWAKVNYLLVGSPEKSKHCVSEALSKHLFENSIQPDIATVMNDEQNLIKNKIKTAALWNIITIWNNWIKS